MAMAQKYIFIAISFYRNIVRENVSCELGLLLQYLILQQFFSPKVYELESWCAKAFYLYKNPNKSFE